MIRNRKLKNLLEMRPVLKPALSLNSIQDAGCLEVVIPRTSWIEKISIRFLRQPTHIRVRLDELGSFAISCCDGNHTVSQIERKMVERFGAKAEPALPRLVKFLEMVEANGWIDWG